MQMGIRSETTGKVKPWVKFAICMAVTVGITAIFATVFSLVDLSKVKQTLNDLRNKFTGQNDYDAPDHGVNLAGWLIFDPNLTPSLSVQLNSSKDEWNVGLLVNVSNNAKVIYENHRNGFVTLSTLSALKIEGVSHLRVPIGYWAFMNQSELYSYNEPYVDGSLNYLTQLVQWSKLFDLKILISLHALPGHQNSLSSSGRANSVNFGNENSLSRSYEILNRLGKYVKSLELLYNGTIIGVSVINAPEYNTFGLNILTSYYKTGYEILSEILDDQYQIVIDATGLDINYATNFNPYVYSNLVFDYHLDYCASNTDSNATSKSLCNYDSYYLKHKPFSNDNRNQDVVLQNFPKTMIGEFSICGVTGSKSSFSTYLDVFERSGVSGWYYYNFHSDANIANNFNNLFSSGLISIDSNDTKCEN